VGRREIQECHEFNEASGTNQKGDRSSHEDKKRRPIGIRSYQDQGKRASGLGPNGEERAVAFKQGRGC